MTNDEMRSFLQTQTDDELWSAQEELQDWLGSDDAPSGVTWVNATANLVLVTEELVARGLMS
jgi:hypothetical protein